MHHRKDIDGLRAVAILPVVLFHAESSIFSGGFVGVDVFFVISGFLITSILFKQLNGGGISITRFYERRIRRIFPALFAVLAVSFTACFMLYMPGDFQEFSTSLTATATFFSNFIFWRGAGYFDTSAEIKPLLHTWSLAVEEQFYIGFPLLLIILDRLKMRRHVVAIIWIGFLGSLAASIWTVFGHPAAAFFLTPFRAWELMLGSILAVGGIPALRSQISRDVVSLVGLGLILTSVCLFDDKTLFPGATALLPCIGAAAIIHAGTGGHSAAGRLLAVPPLVWAGLISYSLYLWHWPIFVFAKYYIITPLTVWQTILFIALAVLVSALSWRFVEQPFRKENGVFTWPQLRAAAAGFIALAVTVGLAGTIGKGWPERLPHSVEQLASYTTDFNPRRPQCHGADFERACVYGAVGPASYAVWGDSHGAEIVTQIGQAAERSGRAALQLTFSSCPPVTGFEFQEPECAVHNTKTLAALIDDTSIRMVFMVAKHAYYIHRWPDRSADYVRQFTQTAAQLAQAGKTVVLVYPFPEVWTSVPTALARMARTGRDPADLFIPENEYRARNKIILDALDAIEIPGVLRVHPTDRLCADGRCRLYAQGKPLYFDSNHISLTGAAYVMPAFEPALTRLEAP